MTASFMELPRPLAFALSGGGSYGAVQVGMLRALREAAIDPDIVVGTSVGALNGAVLASRPTGQAVDALEEIWDAIDRKTVFGGGFLRTALRVARHRTSALDPSRLADLIDHHVPVETIEDMLLSFGAVATVALTGEPLLLRHGRLRPALLASSAIPGVFPAIDHDHRQLVDGGISANLPIRQAFAMGAASVVALDAMPLRSTMPTGPISSVMQSTAVMFRNQYSAHPEPHAGAVLHLPVATPDGMNSLDFRRSGELIMAGYSSTAAFLTVS